ncbi:hypothetical protein AB0I28_29925 [Phytomonospora sp. NPDC050363]|uniref:hypothetical protein n=1 Tax=Phytomonospora sp. NPDC050363 TaxID=3155642 RepID=UPI0033EAF18C
MVPNPESGPAEPEQQAAAPPPPPPAPTKTLAPETHGRGVRMAIYLSGVAIMLALIGWIVFLPPDSPGPGGGAGDDATPSASAPPEAPDPLLAADGTVDPAAYVDMADKLATETGMNWRMGSDWHKYHGKTDFDSLTQKPAVDTRTLDLQLGNVDRNYQFGTPPGDLSSLRDIQGQVGYIPTEEQLPGVDHITSVETTGTTIGYAPRPGGRLSNDGHPEVELANGGAGDCASAADVPVGDMVDMARADGLDGSAHAVMVFDKGLIATAGTSGTQGGQCLKLPKNLVPTAVAVTPGNEFALITVWDTKKIQGGLAVVALTGKPQNTRADFARPFPALPNSGYTVDMKLLGVVPLDEMVAPTAIGVTTDFHGNTELDRRQEWLTSVEGRAAAEQNVAHNGRAIIVSAAERKAVTVDLTPLFTATNEAYFGETVTGPPVTGDGKKEWPFTFSGKKAMTPVVGNIVALPSAPNAASLAWDGKVGYVATRDGQLRVLAIENAAQVAEVGQIPVGANPTCVTHSKDGAQLIVTSRGDRAVQWIQPEGTSGTIDRTLTDSRLADPVCAEELGSLLQPGEVGVQATTVPVLAVADFGGGLVHNYRIGEGVFADGTKVELPTEGFEYGGAYDPKGKPFRVSVTLDRPA